MWGRDKQQQGGRDKSLSLHLLISSRVCGISAVIPRFRATNGRDVSHNDTQRAKLTLRGGLKSGFLFFLGRSLNRGDE